MNSNKCGWNSFPEPLTGGLTCTKCIYVCDPLYQTPELCERYCPEYLKRIGLSTLPTVTLSASYVEKQVEKRQQATLTVSYSIVALLTVIGLLLCVAICVGTLLFFMKKRKHGAEKHHEAVYSNEEKGLLKETHADVVISSGNNSSGGSTYGNNSSGRSTSGIYSAGNTASTSVPSPALGSADGRSSESSSANRCGGSNNPAVRCSTGGILAETCGNSRSADGSHVGSSSRSQSVLSSGQAEMIPVLGAKLETNSMSTVSSGRSFLALNSVTLSQHSPSREQTLVIMPWQNVLRVYDAINCHLHELTWITGCMLDKNRIYIIAGHGSRDDMNQQQHQIRNIIPDTISSEIFQLTSELPSLKTRCGNYCTGCIVMNEKGKIAKLTIQGSRMHETGNEMDVLVFTVAHLLKEGESCQLFCSCGSKIIHEQKAQCLGHVDTVKDEFVYDINHKLFDLSLIQVQGFTFTGNRCPFTYKGRHLFLDIDIRKVDLDPHSIMPGMKVLILADHSNQPITGCISDEAIFTCRSDKSAIKQVINFIQIQSTDENRSLDFDGISGSLIVQYPANDFIDGDVISVEAFAFIIGTNGKRPDRAIALPLWDQMVRLFQKNKSLADLEKNITFQGHYPCHAYDSGICSQIEV